MDFIRSSFFLSGTALALSVMGANVVNLFFNAYLGRVVSAEEFGVLSLINTFMYFGSLFYNALGGITNREVAFLDNSLMSEAGTIFFLSLTKQLLIVNCVLSLLWFIAVPYTATFFHLHDHAVFYLFTPLFILYPLAFLGRGYLQGKMFFILAGITIFIEPVIKLISAFVLFSFQLHQHIYLAIYISAIITGIITFLLAWNKKSRISKKISSSFPLTFFGAALLSGISTISFLAVDMILVKHFLPPEQAGQYAYLSLLGKIIFFAGSLLNIFTISLVSKEARHKRNPYVPFYLLFAGSTVMASGGVLVFGIWGEFFIPLILTQKANQIVTYALPYLISIALFTLGNTIVTYHLALKQYIFSIISFMMGLAIIGGIVYNHSSILDIVYTLLIVSIFYSFILILVHIRQNFFAPRVALSPLEKIAEEII